MTQKPSIVITGGLGYIGSHIANLLLEENWGVIIIDNCCNSEISNLDNIRRSLSSIDKAKYLTFYQTDLCHQSEVDQIFNQHQKEIFAVIHCAGLKAVGESVREPLLYYHNNLQSTINLLKVMQRYHCYNFIFSSSATVYGIPRELPLIESSPISPINPYGQTKYMIEGILKDLYDSSGKSQWETLGKSQWNICVLRYFNPIGAHKSGYLNDQPKGTPNNLMPFLIQVIKGQQPHLQIFGSDYDTPDGTGVRDYIHILDLAQGHLCALEAIFNKKPNDVPFGYQIFNLGTGKGYSVMEILKTMESLIHRSIPYQIADRRPGDAAQVYANADKAKEYLAWETKHSLIDMCQDSLNGD